MNPMGKNKGDWSFPSKKVPHHNETIILQFEVWISNVLKETLFLCTDRTTFSQNTVNDFITIDWVHYSLFQSIIRKSSNELPHQISDK